MCSYIEVPSKSGNSQPNKILFWNNFLWKISFHRSYFQVANQVPQTYGQSQQPPPTQTYSGYPQNVAQPQPQVNTQSQAEITYQQQLAAYQQQQQAIFIFT